MMKVVEIKWCNVDVNITEVDNYISFPIESFFSFKRCFFTNSFVNCTLIKCYWFTVTVDNMSVHYDVAFKTLTLLLNNKLFVQQLYANNSISSPKNIAPFATKLLIYGKTFNSTINPNICDNFCEKGSRLTYVISNWYDW